MVGWLVGLFVRWLVGQFNDLNAEASALLRGAVLANAWGGVGATKGVAPDLVSRFGDVRKEPTGGVIMLGMKET